MHGYPVASECTVWLAHWTDRVVSIVSKVSLQKRKSTGMDKVLLKYKASFLVSDNDPIFTRDWDFRGILLVRDVIGKGE